MSFIGYMLCIVAALLAGVILDRVILKLKDYNTDYEYSSVSFQDKVCAEMVLESLNEILKRNRVIRVYDYYVLCGICNNTSNDFKYGWNDASGFTIDKINDERYVLNPPEPHLLEN